LLTGGEGHRGHREGTQGIQPILFGTDVAFMRIVSGAKRICESLDAETWRRRGEDFAGTRRRFSERAAANGPARSNVREPTLLQSSTGKRREKVEEKGSGAKKVDWVIWS